MSHKEYSNCNIDATELLKIAQKNVHKLALTYVSDAVYYSCKVCSSNGTSVRSGSFAFTEKLVNQSSERIRRGLINASNKLQ